MKQKLKLNDKTQKNIIGYVVIIFLCIIFIL